MCKVVFRGCRCQRRSICHVTSRLWNLTNSPDCSMKLRLLCNCVAEQLVSELCNSLGGNEQGSPASTLSCRTVRSNSLVFVSSCFTEICRGPGAVGGGAGGVVSLSTPCASHFCLHPAHTCPPVCVCMCACMRLGGSVPSLKDMECSSFTARRWAHSPPADAGVKVNAPQPAAEHACGVQDGTCMNGMWLLCF